MLFILDKQFIYVSNSSSIYTKFIQQRGRVQFKNYDLPQYIVYIFKCT